MVLSKSIPMRIASGLHQIDQRTPDFAEAEIGECFVDVGQPIRLRQELSHWETVPGKKTPIPGIVAIGNAVATPGAEQALALVEDRWTEGNLRVVAGIADDNSASPLLPRH